MQISITKNIDGARNAEGIVVIIDVFRAFSTAYYLLANNAKQVMPVNGDDAAFAMKESYPDSILIGETRGKKVEGFDYGNSPLEIKDLAFYDKTLILKSTRGTTGLGNVDSEKADEVLVGAFLGIEAIANYIKHRNPEKVTLVCMGNSGDEDALEDNLFTESLQDLLQGKSINYQTTYDKIRSDRTAERFFDPTLTHSPQEDFNLCLEFNKFDFVMKYNLKTGVLEKAQY